MTANEILQTAIDIRAERTRTHSDVWPNHLHIAELWGAYLGVEITARDAALMMVLLKVARTKAGEHNPDDYVDGAGYFACAGEIAEWEA